MLDPATETGRALLDELMNRQAAIVAYSNDFKLMMLLTIAAMPLVLLMQGGRHRGAAPADAAVAH
mgnify:CR=1 FL=1